jgi:hypothetical protein
VLERLSRPAATAAEAAPEVTTPEPAQGAGVLESLVRHQPTAPRPSSAATTEPPAAHPAVDLSKANDALSGLLGGKGGPSDRK